MKCIITFERDGVGGGGSERNDRAGGGEFGVVVGEDCKNGSDNEILKKLQSGGVYYRSPTSELPFPNLEIGTLARNPGMGLQADFRNWDSGQIPERRLRAKFRKRDSCPI